MKKRGWVITEEGGNFFLTNRSLGSLALPALFLVALLDLESGSLENQNLLFSASIQSDLIWGNVCYLFSKHEVAFHKIYPADGGDAFAVNIEYRLQFQVLFLYFWGIVCGINARWQFKGIQPWLAITCGRSSF